ncbi:MAG: glycosyltransferase family 39 protein, partial [Candidatus Melainabacteria bacterium]|nr:glycosyltransferase family 39 protein [Candidatus Melainabacteria bacterium]
MKLLKRISLYLAFILPALGLLISRLRNQEFNSDEFQHTYLAWANLNYDQMPYRDLWDNHGSLYTFSNSLLMKLANLKAGVDTILVERYFNLFIFVLGALVLFELFRLLTNKIHYAALGTWLFALTNFATYTIQVRPDNLQCLFLYLGLLLITKAIKKNQNQYAFLAGISFVLMLMTNAKSISALCGVIIALVLIKIIDKQSTSLSILWSVIQGLALALLAFAIFFASQGMLENYLIYSILYNKDLVLHDVERVVGTAKAYYLRRHQWFFAITIPALGYWSYKGLGKKIDTAKLVIIITIVIAAIPRIVFSSLWMQYDLLLIPLASFIASCFIIEVLEKYLVPHIASTKLQIGLLVYLVILSSSWYQVFKQSNPLEQYLASVDERVNFLVDNLAED